MSGVASFTTSAEAARALGDGLRAQLERLSERLAGGMPRAGWKVCVNEPRMQKRLGLGGSFAAFLDGSRALESDATWRLESGARIGVEPEVALRFRARVTAGASDDELRAAIAGAAPAIEIVDWRDARLDLASIAAGASFHAGFVTGALRPLEAVPAIGDGCPHLVRGDDVLGVPDASLMPADPLVLVRHVAAFLEACGQTIEAGDWLLGGACTNPAGVEAGDEITADFGPLGAVRVRFES